jgi:hypothetical protein
MEPRKSKGGKKNAVATSLYKKTKNFKYTLVLKI